MALNFYVGQDFNGAGRIGYAGNPTPGYYGTYGENGNQPDFSQWSITAGVYTQKGKLVYTFDVVNLSNLAVPKTNGCYQVFGPGADTAIWPVQKLQVLVKAVSSGFDARINTFRAALEGLLQSGGKRLSRPVLPIRKSGIPTDPRGNHIVVCKNGRLRLMSVTPKRSHCSDTPANSQRVGIASTASWAVGLPSSAC
ncbi:hypothetical protein [Caballeronia sp. INSB1]|uniref:hypothetical protein n=1 Tax=Caballeronia sp. INSB1 TaxID=2921751 RepID=UPI002032396A|nr:hypothetical protein [Caballeronia sp. INSB1]